MATKHVPVYIDDLSGSELHPDDHQQIRFGLEGTEYVIDLSQENAQQMLAQFGRYTAAASVVRKAVKPNRERRSYLQQVREWAAAEGIHVATRGRVSAEVLAAYRAVH